MSNNNPLGLPPINSNINFGTNPDGINLENQLLPRSEIKETNQDSIRRRVFIEINASNIEIANKRLCQMDQTLFIDFYKNSQFIVEMNLEAQGTPYQKYTDAFSDRLVKVMAHHTFGLLEAGALRIAYEVNRPIPLEDQPKGLMGLLFRKE
jgi:hypothetical protein